MMTRAGAVFLVLGCSLLGGCSRKSEPVEVLAETAAVTPPTAAASAAARATVDDGAVPVEEDYIEQAQREITQDNLESQLDALEQEIGEPD
jgi:hypothetical protein